jgi:hypothetical protein
MVYEYISHRLTDPRQSSFSYRDAYAELDERSVPSLQLLG